MNDPIKNYKQALTAIVDIAKVCGVTDNELAAIFNSVLFKDYPHGSTLYVCSSKEEAEKLMESRVKPDESTNLRADTSRGKKILDACGKTGLMPK